MTLLPAILFTQASTFDTSGGGNSAVKTFSSICRLCPFKAWTRIGVVLIDWKGSASANIILPKKDAPKGQRDISTALKAVKGGNLL